MEWNSIRRGFLTLNNFLVKRTFHTKEGNSTQVPYFGWRKLLNILLDDIAVYQIFMTFSVVMDNREFYTVIRKPAIVYYFEPATYNLHSHTLCVVHFCIILSNLQNSGKEAIRFFNR
jgi:hypothetical protein